MDNDPPFNPPAMPAIPPPLGYQALGQSYARDDEHLKLLSIFHYVVGGLELAFSCFAIIYIVMGIAILVSPQGSMFPMPIAVTQPGANGSLQTSPGTAGFEQIMGIMFTTMGSIFLIIGWTVGLLTIYSARCIAKRRRSILVLVMAGVSCLWVPFGTALGVFTFIVMLRDSVKRQFETTRAANSYGADSSSAAVPV